MKTYYAVKSGINGTAFLRMYHNKRDFAQPWEAGFIVSTYGGFAPAVFQQLENGFHSKAALAEYCQHHGFAIYWNIYHNPLDNPGL